MKLRLCLLMGVVILGLGAIGFAGAQRRYLGTRKPTHRSLPIPRRQVGALTERAAISKFETSLRHEEQKKKSGRGEILLAQRSRKVSTAADRAKLASWLKGQDAPTLLRLISTPGILPPKVAKKVRVTYLDLRRLVNQEFKRRAAAPGASAREGVKDSRRRDRKLRWDTHKDVYGTADSESRPVIYAGPPFIWRGSMRVDGKGSRPRLHIGYSILLGLEGDGVHFLATIKPSKGPTRQLLSRYINTKLLHVHRRWFDLSLDLSPYQGQVITLTLETRCSSPKSPNPEGDCEDDFALWSQPFVSYARKPGEFNVLLISTDTLRADRLNAYGFTRHRTSPAIDRLASEGVLFQTAIVQSPWTTPSHMSLFTSLYPSSHGVNSRISDRFRRLEDSHVTLAEVLRDRGFLTAAVSGGSSISLKWGFDQGFRSYRDEFFRNRRGNDIQLTSAYTRRWLRANRDRKFFFFWHTYEPHRPYADTSFVDPENVDDPREYMNSLYNGDVKRTDHYVGQILKELEDLGLLENTLVILLSDHGEDIYDHYPHWRPGEHGQSMYDELLKVPLILRLPARLPANKVVPRQVQIIDVMPTILDLMGISNPPFLQGNSFVPLMLGQESKWAGRFAFSEAINRGPERKSLRTERYKYIYAPDPKGDFSLNFPPVPKEELFDLQKDPKERRNLVKDLPKVREYMRKNLFRILDQARRQGRKGVSLRMDKEMVERLRSLGYIE